MEVQMNTSTTPSPAVMQKFAPRMVADLAPSTPTEGGAHDGIVKTKNLKAGMVVRAWFNGEPHGGERTVGADPVKATEDGAMWTVTFSSPHPDQTYKAAYRWFVAELVGTPLPAPRKPAHLTQTIAEALA